MAQLIKDISKRVRAIKPDILIEFRQPYNGPVGCGAANMMRVNDCPNDALFNRLGSVELRLLTGKTAVHSDMIGWNNDDTPQGCARQLVGVLFSVPQISVKLEEQREDQLKTLKFYMDFYMENRETLLDGKIIPLNPEANYSVVIGEKDNKAVVVCYSKNYVKLTKKYDSLSIVNGTEEDIIILNNDGEAYEREITIYDCMGNALEKKSITVNNGLNAFNIPPCGLIKI